MTDRDLESAVRGCICAARAIVSLRKLYAADEGDAYAACINEALSPILHLLSDLFQKCALSHDGEPPWFDFGSEPLTVHDAESKLTEFLE